MSGAATTVSKLGRDDVPNVVDVLAESFRDYPVMRFVLGTDQEDYERQLQALIRFFVMARVHRNETILGIKGSANLLATALVSRPGGAESPPELGELRARLWESLGASAQSRYKAFGEACSPFDPGVPHLHLNMIGVREESQGQGIGGALIGAVHQLSAEDPISNGVSLTTEDEANVALYRHLGYEIVGHANVTSTLATWAFFRAD